MGAGDKEWWVKTYPGRGNGEERPPLPNRLLQLDMVANAHELSKNLKHESHKFKGQPEVHVSSRMA